MGKAGRKTKYIEEYNEELVKHMTDGNSYTSFASKIGVNVDTLYEWEKKFPEFSEAKKVGLTNSQTYWEDMGKELAHKHPSIYIFNMKNRFGWHDMRKEQKEINLKTEVKGYGLAFNLSKTPEEVRKINEEKKRQRDSSDRNSY